MRKSQRRRNSPTDDQINHGVWGCVCVCVCVCVWGGVNSTHCCPAYPRPPGKGTWLPGGQLAYFAKMRTHSERLDRKQSNWGGDLTNCVTRASHVAGNPRGEIRGKSSAVRFRCIISGVGDFAQFGGRHQQVLNGMRRGHKTNQKRPCSLDVMGWVHTEFLQSGLAIPARVELYKAAVLVFSSCWESAHLRGAECLILN